MTDKPTFTFYPYETAVFNLRLHKQRGIDIHNPKAVLLEAIAGRDVGLAWWLKFQTDEYPRALAELDAEDTIEPTFAEVYKEVYEILKEAILVIGFNHPSHETYLRANGIDPEVIAKRTPIDSSFEAMKQAHQSYLRVLDFEIAELAWQKAIAAMARLPIDKETNDG